MSLHWVDVRGGYLFRDLEELSGWCHLTLTYRDTCSGGWRGRLLAGRKLELAEGPCSGSSLFPYLLLSSHSVCVCRKPGDSAGGHVSQGVP